jgi:hypothetical protein
MSVSESRFFSGSCQKDFEDGIMSTRRKAYWWFWFVASGRFLETFLNLRRKRS